jgi:Glycosyltransferase family 87
MKSITVFARTSKLFLSILLVLSIFGLEMTTWQDNLLEHSSSSIAADPSAGRVNALLSSNVKQVEELDFMLKLNGSLLKSNSADFVLLSDGQGASLTLVSGVLFANFPLRIGGIIASYPIADSNSFSAKPERVCLILQNGQTAILEVNGKTENSYTYNRDIFENYSGNWTIAKNSALQVTDLKMVVTPELTVGLLGKIVLRFLQILFFLAIAFALESLLSLSDRLRKNARSISRENLLVIFSILIVGTLINLIFVFMKTGYHPITYWPTSGWLDSSYPRFSDFFQSRSIALSFNPYGVLQGNYPPLAYLLLLPFGLLNQYTGLFLMEAVAISTFIWWVRTELSSESNILLRAATVAAVLISLPVSFALDRGNIILIAVALLLIALRLFENTHSRDAAAVIGVVASLKIYPLLYFATIYKKVRLRSLMLGTSIPALLSALVLFSLPGGFFQNFQSMVRQVLDFAGGTVATVENTNYNASLDGFLQAVAIVIHGPGVLGQVLVGSSLAQPCCFALCLLATLYWIVESDPHIWRSLTILSLLPIMFSSMSPYYELIFLIPGTFYFLEEIDTSRRSRVTAILFGLVLVPKAYFYIFRSVDVSVLFQFPLEVALAYVTVFRRSSANH